MPSSLFRRTSVSSASSKTIFLFSLFALLFIASSWNLLSFSKISIHIGDVHHSPSTNSSAATNKESVPTVSPSMGTTASAQPMPSMGSMGNMGSALASDVSGSTSAAPPDSPLSKIEAGIRQIASAGFDPFSVSLVNPKMEIKKTELEHLSPFYQLLITQNKDVKLLEPPPAEKPKEGTATFNPSAGGVAVETIPVIPNPIEGIKLSGVSYMPKKSFAMLDVSGQSNAAIVSQGQVIDVAGQQVKVVSIARGTVSLCWVGAPKGVTATQKLTIPDIIGYKPTSTSGSSASTPAAPGALPAGVKAPMGGAVGSASSQKNSPPVGNTPEDIEKLVNAAMKP